MRFEQCDITSFGLRLRAARDAAGLTRQAVADATEQISNPQQIYNYETGRRAPETIQAVLELEEAVGLERGTLCRILRFRPLSTTEPRLHTEDAIASDSRLDPGARAQLLSAYRRLAR